MEIKDLRQLAGLNECGMTPAAPINPPSPASVSMTAASGSELSSMLKDIMSLAGMSKVEPAQLGIVPPPMKMSPEPVKAVGPVASDGEVMRGIADKMNLDKDDGEEKKADEAWDNAPANPEPKEPFDAEEYAHHENPPGAGKGRRTMQPNATVEEIAENLFAEYAKFISEDEEVDEAKDEEVDEEKSWFDMTSKERAAHVASGKSKAHRSGSQPGHGPAPAKTSAGDIKSQAADRKAHTGKSEYKGKEDDV